MTSFSLNVNGRTCEVECDPATPLIYVLRNHLDLVGAKLGCGLEQCGACAILVDGERVLSCVRAASEFEGAEITTVEGLVQDGEPSVVQQAFIEEGAAQCGYCTAGLVIATTALLEKTPRPDDTEIQSALNDHLCRCGSHARVLRAIDVLVQRGAGDA
ncbi:MAG: (2Fe-2S)-binding protein [Rhodospirillaceae bacterium]|nr:(2Fe-2S)-binding protein [Rhodospirillaceae bacterium]|tara:strand:+ start:4122 stop:4595 length:474 start_codon:yes stop_codon:yes gene_type:complete